MHLQIKSALDKGACQQYGEKGSCMRGMCNVDMNYNAAFCPHRHSVKRTAELQCAIGTNGSDCLVLTSTFSNTQ